jgi:choline dehydrogenase-like flavoprotein
MSVTHIVIGSGPAGVACAKALLARGQVVRMLDTGIQLEAARAQVVRELAALAPAQWRPEQVALLKEGMASSAKGIPLKRVYGSDFPYREAERHVPAHYVGIGFRPSLALGGFSNVWGAAMLPYVDADLDGWPVRVGDLAAHYRAVLEFTGLAAGRDDLDKLLPLHLPEPGGLEASRQSKRLLGHLQRHRDWLGEQGVHFGHARAAVQSPRAGAPGCVYCGLCMYGCPYGYIYNSADTVRAMQSDPRFTYQPATVVTRVGEQGTTVSVSGYEREGGAPFSMTGARVYLAAGVVPTTKILLQSRAQYDQPLTVGDSQYFLFPLLQLRGTPAVASEALYTLSQLFLEVRDPKIDRHTVHLQVYSYNDLIGQAIRQSLGPLARPLESLARQLEQRMLIVQGYLHSAASAQIAMNLRRGQAGAADYLEVQSQLNPQTRRTIQRVLRLFLRLSPRLGALPLAPLLQVAEPGRGFHSGGSFPMQDHPREFGSDRLGRPCGWQRIHAVDATVLPSVPATTITFSVMANAHRIGWEAATLDRVGAGGATP